MSSKSLFQFVGDRAPQGAISGSFAPVADQSKFRSIWGVVSGPQIGPWTARQIEDGDIFSGDNKARLGGIPVRQKDGTYHDVSQGSTIFREFQIPLKDVEKWNRYEALQSQRQCEAISKKEFGEHVSAIESKQWDEEDEIEPQKFETQATVQGVDLAKKEAARARAANARAAAAAKRATKKVSETTTPPS